jgi:hypothetical protein
VVSLLQRGKDVGHTLPGLSLVAFNYVHSIINEPIGMDGWVGKNKHGMDQDMATRAMMRIRKK